MREYIMSAFTAAPVVSATTVQASSGDCGLTCSCSEPRCHRRLPASAAQDMTRWKGGVPGNHDVDNEGEGRLACPARTHIALRSLERDAIVPCLVMHGVWLHANVTWLRTSRQLCGGPIDGPHAREVMTKQMLTIAQQISYV